MKKRTPPDQFDRDRCITELNDTESDALDLLRSLSDEQINTQPSVDRWSVGQCIDHLIVTGTQTEAALRQAITTARANGMLERRIPAYGWLSRWVLRFMEPPVERRTKAPVVFRPSARLSHEDLELRFREMHKRVIESLEKSRGLDMAGIRVTSPATRFIRYPAGLSFDIIAAHERRHLWQAHQVKQLLFPGSKEQRTN